MNSPKSSERLYIDAKPGHHGNTKHARRAAGREDPRIATVQDAIAELPLLVALVAAANVAAGYILVRRATQTVVGKRAQ